MKTLRLSLTVSLLSIVLISSSAIAYPIDVDGMVVAGGNSDKESFINKLNAATGGEYQLGVRRHRERRRCLWSPKLEYEQGVRGGSNVSLLLC